MKKGLKILVIVLVTIVISGCDKGKEVVKTCKVTSNQSANGYILNSNYEVHSKDGIVTRVETKEVVKSDNKQVREYFKNYLEKEYKKASETYGGYTYSITDDGNNVTSKVKINYSKMNLDKFIKDNPQIKSYVNKNNKITLDGIQKVYESLGATCE